MATLVGDRERERTAGDLGLALTQGFSMSKIDPGMPVLDRPRQL
jgi:hypothetical protein